MNSSINNQFDDFVNISHDDRYTRTTTPYEHICDQKYLNKNVYPPDSEHLDFYKLWVAHDEIAWNAGENHPIHDTDMFSTAPKQLQKAVLNAMAVLTIGDRAVLDMILTPENNKLQSITVPCIKAFFTSQAAREAVHNAQYSGSLDISDDPEYYRGEEFYKKFMQKFVQFTEKYKDLDSLSVQCYLVMLCEFIMFSGPFYIICYAASLGYVSNIKNINEQAMRDEYMHYQFYRKLSAALNNKISNTLAKNMLADFEVLVLEMSSMILDGYEDDAINNKTLIKYVQYTVHTFKYENMLYDNTYDADRAHKKYNVPLPIHMMGHLLEQRSNLMEGVSTIYKASAGNPHKDDNNYSEGW